MWRGILRIVGSAAGERYLYLVASSSRGVDEGLYLSYMTAAVNRKWSLQAADRRNATMHGRCWAPQGSQRMSLLRVECPAWRTRTCLLWSLWREALRGSDATHLARPAGPAKTRM